MDGKFIIDNLLEQNINDRLDFILTIDEDILAKKITAMLNSRGGDIIIGVDYDKRIIGVSNKDTNELSKALINRIRPSVPIDIRSIDYDGKNVLLVSVWEGAQKPYHCDGQIYQKSGNEIVIANSESIGNILLDRKRTDFNWERMPVLGAEMDDLDMDEVRRTMKEYARMSNDDIDDEILFLMRNGLLKDGNLTNACIILYAKTPAQFIAQARIKLSIYSSDTDADLVDTRLFEGNIFKNTSALFQFIDMTYPKSIKIDGLFRKERSGYPQIAVREGIMNAIVHRDYNSISGFMHIHLYPNRLEIVNYGILPSMESIIVKGGDGLSMLRNPDIAHQCYYRKLIEMMGSGISRMIHDCKQNGFEIPVFEVKEQIVKVSFPNIYYSRIDNQHQENTDTNLMPYFESEIEKVSESIDKKIIEKLALILCTLKKQPGLRTTMLSKKTEIPVKSLERYIKLLKETGLIRYSGSNKSGGYFLSDSVLRE